jgi:methylated-DNA-[protein]-cysteine S-methyltransferase
MIMSKRELVYDLLKNVPKERVTTYMELAKAASTHPRAVAAFMRTNDDPVKVPCFRVVRSSGGVGGYSAEGGIRKKAELLKRDGIVISDGKIDLDKYLHRF